MYLPFFGRMLSIRASTTFVANGINGIKLMIVDLNAVRCMYRLNLTSFEKTIAIYIQRIFVHWNKPVNDVCSFIQPHSSPFLIGFFR